MKKVFVFMAVLAIAAMLVSGCSVPAAPSANPTPDNQVPAPTPADSIPSTEPDGSVPTTEPSPTTPSAGQQQSTGTLEVRVTDAPPEHGQIKEIWVEVDAEEGILVHKAAAEQEQEQEQQDGGEWLLIPIAEDNNPFELLALKDAGVDELLGWSEVDAGKYTQIRMAIKEVIVIFEGETEADDDDIEETAKLPSGKLKFIHPFNVVDGGTTILLFDFIADKSVNVTGNGKVIFKPVIKLVVSGDIGPGGDADLELATKGAASAEWSQEETHSGKYSVHLETTGDEGDGDEARIIYHLPEGTTLGDIDSISWWEYLLNGYPPHVDIMLDFDDPGEDGAGEVDDSLVFEYAYNTEDHYADAPMPYGALTGDWYKTFSDDGEGPAQVDDDASGWLASGPPGAPGDSDFIYYTLEEWKDGVDVDGDTSVDIDSTTLVLALEIEVDNWVVQSEAYVDDIVVDYTE
jgi:hypothetical protein